MVLLLVTCAVCRLSTEKLSLILLQANDSSNGALGRWFSTTGWRESRSHLPGRERRRFCTSLQESSLWIVVTVSVTIAVGKHHEEPGNGWKSFALCCTNSSWHKYTARLLNIINGVLVRVAIHLSWQGQQLSSCTPSFCRRCHRLLVWYSANPILKINK